MNPEFEALFAEQLQDVYSAEKQILKALPKMVKAAKAPELKKAFAGHLDATRTHVVRLEEIFKARGLSKGSKKCHGMAGLLEEGAEILASDLAPAVRDAALISAAQRVEHYEMAAYGCLRAFAKVLGDLDSAKTLQATLDEEGDADRTLTQLGEFTINDRAALAS